MESEQSGRSKQIGGELAPLWKQPVFWLTIVAGIAFLGLLFFWQGPRVARLLPGQVHQLLPGRVAAWLATPLPTALPAPSAALGPLPTIPPLAPSAAPPATSSAAAMTPLPDSVSPGLTPLPAETGTADPPRSPTATPLPTPPPPPTAVRLEGLEIIPQKFNNCGPANLTINLGFYGVDIPQLEIAAHIRPTYDDRNVSPWELVDYVNDETPLRAAMFSGGDLPTLKRLLAAGFPVVVEKGLIPSEREGWMGHYLTLIGYDDAMEAFITLDTFLGPWDGSGLHESYATLNELWRHFNYTFWVVYTPEQETLLQNSIPAALRTSRSMWQAAGARAQADIAANEDDPFAWFNLGSSLIRLAEETGEPGYASDAAVAFDRARQLRLPWRMLWYQFTPYEAYLAAGRAADVIVLAEATLSGVGGQFVEESYYFYGQALAAGGETDRALTALRRAVELNPSYEQAAAALADLEN